MRLIQRNGGSAPLLGSVRRGWGPPTLPYQPELVAKPSRCGNGKHAQAAPYEGVDGPEGGHGASVVRAVMMVICPQSSSASRLTASQAGFLSAFSF